MNCLTQTQKSKKLNNPFKALHAIKDIKFDRYWLFFPISILFMELLTKLITYGSIFDSGLIYVPLFSIVAGIGLTLLCTIFNAKTNRRLTLIFACALGIFFSFVCIYFNVMKTFFVFKTITIAGDVTEFWQVILLAIAKNLYVIILLQIPFVVYLLYGDKFKARKLNAKIRLLALPLLVIIHCFAVLLMSFNSGYFSDKYYYNSTLSPSDTVCRFGVLTTTRMDLQQIVFGSPEKKIENPFQDSNAGGALTAGKDLDEHKPVEKEFADNVLSIDFDKLIENESNEEIIDLHKYFKTVTPTKQNDYTGYFKGKNLIFLTLEGFSYKLIDAELTPTLYKMANEGFVFENFYTSLWGGSTASGEYANLTGNFYTSADCLKKSSSKYLPFTLGNQLKKDGYSTFAYHNNTHTYYNRHIAHPNMGYNYKGIGNGLNGLTDSWPRSDDEMAKVTVDEFIDKSPFHAYYMTVSGHGMYSWSSNNMSSKNKALVEHLPYDENVKAYIACNLEVEMMLNRLISELDKKGILEDTVFAMATDHYPYFLEDKSLSQLYGIDQENIGSNFDLYRNSFILWSASMEKPIKIEKPCSAIDILPTISNLFGLEYDSRLLMGTDILSDTDPVVILNCIGSGGSWHWITPVGSYNTRQRKFTAANNVKMSEEKLNEYVNVINKVVMAKRNYSIKLLDLDYYKYALTK